ncbi:RCC1/BLIP-II [Durotheca rogersii]|uniref:RCC1/BLIP-II n=1 Tax=Durotheca rogersii TaxID=419775 RepID=UPI002220F789|nr:RCC1/BLIP-II [Durotheca rogersii]KAI5863690.1 RCC1/BLIP-II [Durotheca rogersii]
MALRRAALRRTALLYRAVNLPNPSIRQWPRGIVTSDGGGTDGRRRKRGGAGKFLGSVLVALAAGGAVISYPYLTGKAAKPCEEAVVENERSMPLPESKEDNRDIISSQHLQAKKSWESPGVYAWGANSGRVAAPDSSEAVIKTPRRIPYFDGKLLRDIKLDREFGAAVTEAGDLVQWGTAFSKTNPAPVETLRGKNIVKIAISRDRIIALSKDGAVYSVPVASSDQYSSHSSAQSWFSFWSTPDNTVNYRQITPRNLGWFEDVVDISSGLEHALLLTSRGRVFSAASSTSEFPSKGQMGIPGLTWATRPKGPYDAPHEILGLQGFKITQIATGDHHSLALDDKGYVFVFGDNSFGQLGFEVEPEIPFIATPIPLPFNKIYSGTKRHPRITSIAAGGATSFFAVDATRVAGFLEDDDLEDVDQVTADTWACGSGISGSLGTGKWTHVSLGPSKIKLLSGLYEWDEKRGSATPIRLSRLSAGSTHAAAVMDNVTSVKASARDSAKDTNFGADVLFWGGNEFYQLGTGKRNNIPSPTYIEPLDGEEAGAEKGWKGERPRLQVAPRTKVRLGEGGKGRKVSVEQRVECGRFVTAIYSGT